MKYTAILDLKTQMQWNIVSSLLHEDTGYLKLYIIWQIQPDVFLLENLQCSISITNNETSATVITEMSGPLAQLYHVVWLIYLWSINFPL